MVVVWLCVPCRSAFLFLPHEYRVRGHPLWVAAFSLSRVVFLIFIIDSLVLGSSSFVLDQLFAIIVGVSPTVRGKLESGLAEGCRTGV